MAEPRTSDATAGERGQLTLRPFADAPGAEVLGLQAAHIDAALFPAVYEAFLTYQLLLFRDQDLPPAAQVAFARHFGEVQIHVMNQYHASGHPELYYLSNLGADGKPNGVHPDRGTMAWHTDGSWRPVTGQATILFAEQVPSSGGGTGFADMYRALETLAPAAGAGAVAPAAGARADRSQRAR